MHSFLSLTALRIAAPLATGKEGTTISVFSEIGLHALASLQVELSGAVSSQYLTALLMAAPLATGQEGITIRIRDELVSQPYVDMTVRLMERFGIQVSLVNLCILVYFNPKRRQLCHLLRYLLVRARNLQYLIGPLW